MDHRKKTILKLRDFDFCWIKICRPTGSVGGKLTTSVGYVKRSKAN